MQVRAFIFLVRQSGDQSNTKQYLNNAPCEPLPREALHLRGPQTRLCVRQSTLHSGVCAVTCASPSATLLYFTVHYFVFVVGGGGEWGNVFCYYLVINLSFIFAHVFINSFADYDLHIRQPSGSRRGFSWFRSRGQVYLRP